jgi:hypothetical protein
MALKHNAATAVAYALLAVHCCAAGALLSALSFAEGKVAGQHWTMLPAAQQARECGHRIHNCHCICHHPLLQGVAEAECRRAAAAAEDAYRLEFNVEGTPAEPEALLLEHLVRL